MLVLESLLSSLKSILIVFVLYVKGTLSSPHILVMKLLVVQVAESTLRSSQQPYDSDPEP